MNVFQFAQKTFVVRDFDETGLARKLKHPDGVVIGPVPKLGIEMPEKPAGGRLPGPPQVEDHFAQRLEGLGQSGNYIVNLVVWHGTAMNRRREFVRKILGGNFSVELIIMVHNVGQSRLLLHDAGRRLQSHLANHAAFAAGPGTAAQGLNRACATIFARSEKRSLLAVGSSLLESRGMGHCFIPDNFFRRLFASHWPHLNRPV